MDSATATNVEDTDSSLLGNSNADIDGNTMEHPITALVVMIFCVVVLLTILLWFGRQNQWSWCQQIWGKKKTVDDATPKTTRIPPAGDDPTWRLDESDTSQVEDDEECHEQGDAAIVTTTCIEQV